MKEVDVHDKTFWDQISLQLYAINILVDLGFLGADKEYDNVIIPNKNPKNNKLTTLQKQINSEFQK